VFANSLKRIGKWQSHCPPNTLVWTRRLSSKHKEKKSPSPNH
jgi:hypothetical protein